jgi:hypothetical protein
MCPAKLQAWRHQTSNAEQRSFPCDTADERARQNCHFLNDSVNSSNARKATVLLKFGMMLRRDDFPMATADHGVDETAVGKHWTARLSEHQLDAIARSLRKSARYRIGIVVDRTEDELNQVGAVITLFLKH